MSARSIQSFAAACVSVLSLAGSAAARGDVSYPAAEPGYKIEFPRDEGSHPQFKTEWWYLTGWLQNEAGDPFGFQVTFFRTRTGLDEDNPSRFTPRQLLFAHVAVSDPKRGMLVRGERSARAGFGLAGAAEGGLRVHIDDWSMHAEADSYRVVALTGELRLELQFATTQPPLLQGASGFSRKGLNAGAASHYYSLPHLQTTGRIVIEGREHRVRGAAWFDHEWSSGYMDEEAVGWDWVGLNLDGGAALMAFRMRDEHGGERWAGATLRGDPAGAPRSHPPAEIEWSPLREWRSPRTGVRYPIEWQIAIGDRMIVLRPLMDDQESDARGSTGTLYWEGAVRAFELDGRPIGRGYLELTGYGPRMKL
ncbi:MAG: lipocalin-like domain-containing protein [Steroidobacteraceae bacterium]